MTHKFKFGCLTLIDSLKTLTFQKLRICNWKILKLKLYFKLKVTLYIGTCTSDFKFRLEP